MLSLTSVPEPWHEDLSLTKSTAVVAAADITPDGGKEVEDEVETSRAIVPELEGDCKDPELRNEAIVFVGGKKNDLSMVHYLRHFLQVWGYLGWYVCLYLALGSTGHGSSEV